MTKAKPKDEWEKIGRPSDYHPKETIKQTIAYIKANEEDEFYEVWNRHGERDKKKKWFVPTLQTKRKVKLPTIEGLAYHLNISKETVYDWRKKYPDFSYLIGKLLQKQAQKLLENGLSGEYNSVIAKVVLTKHGYREGFENEATAGGEPLTAEQRKKLDKLLTVEEEKPKAKKKKK